MTEKERKKFLANEATFVTDAAQQAESMGIHGFTTDRLAVVCSDSDEDDAAAAACNAALSEGGAKKSRPSQRHAGQRNKKSRSKEDIIREEANMREANRAVRDWFQQVDALLKTTDIMADRSTSKDRTENIGLLSAALARLKESNLAKNFDPCEPLNDGEEVPLKLAMWRLLVESSGMREAEFAWTIDDDSTGQGAAKKTKPARGIKAAASVENLYAFSVINKLAHDCIGAQGIVHANSVSSASANWGKMERLHRVTQPPMTYYEAVSYLGWVYISYVQLHFQMKLMCRIVKLYLDNWKAERERARMAQEAPNIAIGIPLFLYCHHKVLAMIRDHGLVISAEEIDTVRSALMHFDFPGSYYEKVERAISTWQRKPLPLLALSMRPRHQICTETPEMLQLIHMGHLLERPVIPERDYRVVFNPDGWQRELLDIVDARGSAVVCAPTSAGKTFISYYCMYNTLKTSNTKVVVYVAPNRALINQAVADVCARYGSKKYAVAGKTVYGVHGGVDYHRFHDSCQVLVTLPEILETLLLSPKYKDWVERLNYVILDEIHTMESSGNGAVWERVLSLLPCPFIALSATLGEIQQLCGWLNRVQGRLAEKENAKARDYVVHEIPSSGSIQRWNDIKKYIYLPPPGHRPQFKKHTAKCEQRFIRDLHPLSILTLDQLHCGFPPDITLVPSEVVQLYDQMVQQFRADVYPVWHAVAVVRDMDAQLHALCPEEYFKAENYITQRHARQYEADVKNAFAYWVYLSTSGCDAAGFDTLSPDEVCRFSKTMHDVCTVILRFFSLHLRDEENVLEKYAADAAKEQQRQSLTAATQQHQQLQQVHYPDSKEFIGANIIDVLRELSSRDMGPTIVFSFETEECDDLAKSVIEHLEQAEAVYRQTEEFAQYRATMERKAMAKEAARRQRESNLKQKRLTTDDKGDVERVERTTDDAGGDGDDESYEIPEVLPEFSFIGHNCTVDPEVVQKAIRECEKRGDDLSVRAIRRGVGIHHAGMKGKIRRLMEVLFRGRHCGVICATETLALGVHSPCRSVVLAGDHVLLNTTQFRQMMGRAGRRGLDFLGHLIFLSVGMKKITRLMTSSMTVIRGNVQMDAISQLRLLQLFDFEEHRGVRNAEKWKKRVTSMAEQLFVNPLFFEGRAAVEGGNMESLMIELMQLLLAFFQREGLHFRDRPSSLGSLLVEVMHVFRNAQVGQEGFAFIMMLTRGIFAEADFHGDLSFLNNGIFAATQTADPDATCTEAVMELLAYLFSVHKMCGVPLEIHRSALSDPAVLSLWEKQMRGGSARQHRIVLAPLRGCCLTQRPFANSAMLREVSAFYTGLADRLQEPREDRLPYMGANTEKKSPIFPVAEEPMPLVERLKATAVPFKARTPFVALCGCGDNFVNVEDLVSTLRKGLFCDRRFLPILDLTDGCRHDGAQVLINACVADFARCRAQFDHSRHNYRFTLLEELNGLTQSESYAVLNHAERILSNIAGLTRDEKIKPLHVLSTLFPLEEDGYFAGAKRILHFAKHLRGLRSQIEKDYFGDQIRLNEEAKKKKGAAGKTGDGGAAATKS